MFINGITTAEQAPHEERASRVLTRKLRGIKPCVDSSARKRKRVRFLFTRSTSPIKTEHRAFSSKFVAALILVALLAVVLFGFATMSYGADGKMEGNCPFSVMGAPSCPQDLAAAALHHISSYQSLLNAPVSSGFTVLIVALLLLVYGVFIFFIRPPAFQPQLIGYLRRSPHPSARDRETTGWLALFEHSPSLQ